MSLKALQDLIEANPEALAKVKSAANHAEVSEIAKGYGIEVTPAEVMKYAAQQTAELDDDALEAVAGGVMSGYGEMVETAPKPLARPSDNYMGPR